MKDPKAAFNNWVEAETKRNFQLGQPLTFISCDALSYKHIALASLFQKRNIEKRWRQYIPGRSIDSKNIDEDFAPWDIQLTYTTEAEERTFEKELSGTEQVVECYICDGAGKNTCSECNGERESKCNRCYGSCETKCCSCDGRGDITCTTCNGNQTQNQCRTCGDRRTISCSRCRNGYNTCSHCAGHGMVKCKECKGNGEITCDNCRGKGNMCEYSVLVADNFMSHEDFSILDQGLEQKHIDQFEPRPEERHTLSEISKETIALEEVPKEILALDKHRIKEIFEEHNKKTAGILDDADTRKLEMVFGVVSIDEFFKVTYSHGDKHYHLMFFKKEDKFLAEDNPWQYVRKNVEAKIEELYRKSKKSTLKEINKYQRDNITTPRLQAIRKEILNFYVTRDAFLFVLPWFTLFAVLGPAGIECGIQASEVYMALVAIVAALPFIWFIRKRHRARKDKV